MFSKISSTNVLTNSITNNNEPNELLNACDTIRSIFPESSLNKKLVTYIKRPTNTMLMEQKGLIIKLQILNS